jgi:hypothetical protein
VRTRSSQAVRAAAQPAPASSAPATTSGSHAAVHRLAARPPRKATASPASAASAPSARTPVRRQSPAGSHRPLDCCQAASSLPTAFQATAKLGS